MVSVALGARVKDCDFNVTDIQLGGLFENGPKVSIRNGELTIAQNRQDYVVLEGEFKFGFGKDLADMIKSLDAITIVEDGKERFHASHLDLTARQIGDDFAAKRWLEAQDYTIKGNEFDNEIMGAANKDVARGLAGDDDIFGLDGVDKLFGDAGNDDLDGGLGNDDLDGGSDNDDLIGGLGNDDLDGGSGNDDLVGGLDNDDLDAGAGKDDLKGGLGNDDLDGGEDNDHLSGGAGRDTFVFHKGDGQDTITDFVHSGRFQELIDLSHYGEKLRFKDLDISREGKHDVIIDFGKGPDEIVIEDATVKDITASDFNF